MTDPKTDPKDVAREMVGPAAEAWDRDADDLVMAAVGRAENELTSDPRSAEMVKLLLDTPFREDVVMLMRCAMLATAEATRGVLWQSGYLHHPDAPIPEGVPDSVRIHAAQARAAYAKAGLLPSTGKGPE